MTTIDCNGCTIIIKDSVVTLCSNICVPDTTRIIGISVDCQSTIVCKKFTIDCTADCVFAKIKGDVLSIHESLGNLTVGKKGYGVTILRSCKSSSKGTIPDRTNAGYTIEIDGNVVGRIPNRN